jgi:hypothetical protein
MRKPYKVVDETYDLRIEGQEWRRRLSRNALFHAVQYAYKQLPNEETELLFLIEENYSGGDQERCFCMPFQMWEALCEDADTMRMYLRLGWED